MSENVVAAIDADGNFAGYSENCRYPGAQANRFLHGLNAEQACAVGYGRAINNCVESGPQLVIAGAGTGKTATLCHRVAWLIDRGVPADRIGLLTFSRRAAAEMVRRAGELLARDMAIPSGSADLRRSARLVLPWAGTFHSVCSRLLREHANVLGLNKAYSIIDRADAVDLIGWLRDRHGLSTQKKRFPGAATCLNIYSAVVNSAEPLADVLDARFPWCQAFESKLRDLFGAYVERKLADSVLDYDDLLLWCCHGLEKEPEFARRLGAHFDHLLVDEFQDCNALQMKLLLAIKPDGDGLFVVGDDAQSIYSFRAARVELMHEFEHQFDPPARLTTLIQNYRSTQAILNSANALMRATCGPYDKNLRAATGANGVMPYLAIVADDAAQADYVVDQVLAQRENGIALKQQAVLFRSAHHSDFLEIVLARRNIPFVKHGGLKFIEAAHVRDYLAVLRWAGNPNHHLAGFRALQLLPGIGPVMARRLINQLQAEHNGNADTPIEMLSRHDLSASTPQWSDFCALMALLANPDVVWPERLNQLNCFIEPLIEQRYDAAVGRLADLQVLNTIAARSGSADKFLSDMALDPPNATGAWSDVAQLDEDYLILSTVHSAKGQEWHDVFVLNVADGNFPNEYATDNPRAVQEERRLLYVAMTRARQNLHLIEPQRYYLTHQPRLGGAHVYGVRSRFLDPAVMQTLQPFEVQPPEVSGQSTASSSKTGLEKAHRNDDSGPAMKPDAVKGLESKSPVADALRSMF